MNVERECSEKVRIDFRVFLIFRGWEEEEGLAKETEIGELGRGEEI